ncbi:hypothetical protein CLV49_0474 [Labedella gwakjiensis]|uniref:Uncharacterized protein n=1 Tax=Labedella gwakjiensis TaxID=390269 RepID=A0A2P8GSE1_9MICO|nr:hypothetical protein [Labedella gwakjiensis]PSL36872.1 hypothetical protein CLV49_0474 [Labedella gwakjiensis]
MSDYSSPSPEDEVQGTEDNGSDDNVKAGSGTDEDTVSGGEPEQPEETGSPQ